MLQDKVVFLTGGTSGIGWACAKQYAEAGALLSIVSNDAKGLQEAISLLGAQHLGVLCDVSVSGDVAAAVTGTLHKFGRIDVVHNNAGVAGPSVPLHETTDEAWTQLFDVNLKSVLYTTRFALEALKASKGCIIHTSSLTGEIGQAQHAAYTATKGAMNALTKSMALDYAPFGIRVNAVAPAGVWTPMLRAWSKQQPDPANIESYLDGIHALGYCPEGDVVADACVFLASEKARFITGTILPVSGGAELGYKR